MTNGHHYGAGDHIPATTCKSRNSRRASDKWVYPLHWRQHRRPHTTNFPAHSAHLPSRENRPAPARDHCAGWPDKLRLLPPASQQASGPQPAHPPLDPVRRSFYPVRVEIGDTPARNQAHAPEKALALDHRLPVLPTGRRPRPIEIGQVMTGDMTREVTTTTPNSCADCKSRHQS